MHKGGSEGRDRGSTLLDDLKSINNSLLTNTQVPTLSPEV